jgi:hypothetical protein
MSGMWFGWALILAWNAVNAKGEFYCRGMNYRAG